jgi:hypothetical protein
VQLSKRVKVLIVGAASVATFLAAAPMIGGASLSHELGSESSVGNCSNVGGNSRVGGQSSVGGESCTGPSSMITLSSASLTGHGMETITGTQFVVGEKVFLYLFLDAKKLQSLGVVKAKTGSFTMTVSIAGVTAGTHTIAAFGSRGSSASVNFEMLPSLVVEGSPVIPGGTVRSRLAAFHPKSTLTFYLLPRSASGDCPGTLPAAAVILVTSPSHVVTGSKGRYAGTATATIVIPAGTARRKYMIEARDQSHVRACADMFVK